MWKDTLVRSGRETWVRCAALVQHMDNHSYSVIHSRRKPGHSRVCETVLWAKEQGCITMSHAWEQHPRFSSIAPDVERWTLNTDKEYSSMRTVLLLVLHKTHFTAHVILWRFDCKVKLLPEGICCCRHDTVFNPCRPTSLFQFHQSQMLWYSTNHKERSLTTCKYPDVQHNA